MKKDISSLPVCTATQCPISLTTQLIGGRWKHLILFLISQDVRRFGALQRALPEISKNMLTQERRSLERDGILRRHIFAEIPPRVEYTLTEWGEKTLPILQAMADWGEAYAQAHPTNESGQLQSKKPFYAS